MSDDQQPVEPSVRISLSAIYQEVVSTSGKLDAVLAELHQVRATDTDHEVRLRKIEEGSGNYVTHAQARGWLAVILTSLAVLTGLVALIVHN